MNISCLLECLLGLNRQSSKEEIEAAYFLKIQGQTHQSGRLKDETKAILKAYEILIDDETRMKYDREFSDNVEDLVNSASAGEHIINHQNSDSPLGGGERKKDGFDDKLNQDQMYFLVRFLWVTFLLITVPKVTYLGWKKYKGEMM